MNIKNFIEELSNNNINFFTWVPDSLLKDFCAYISDNFDKKENIISANEWNAIWIATWYFLSTWKIPCVYMQNSWLWNAINPLLSLTNKKVYNTPLLWLIWLRWEPWKKDEPQHIKQWEVTIPLLKAMGIKYEILSNDFNIAKKQIFNAVKYIENDNENFFFIIKKWTFEEYNKEKNTINNFKLSRENALKIVIDNINIDWVLISTTWKLSRELFEYREEKNQLHEKDFLTVGSMWHSSQIALWIALNTEKQVYCLDWDGAIIMHTWWLSNIWDLSPENFNHILFNNWSHESVWGQDTLWFDIDFWKIASWFNYENYFKVKNEKELKNILLKIKYISWPNFIEILINKYSRDNLWRPTKTPIENKNDFIKYLQNND